MRTYPNTIGPLLLAAREENELSAQEVTFAVRSLLSDEYRFDPSTLTRWEKNERLRDVIDPVILAALAKLYGKPVKHFSEAHAEAVRRVRDLVNQSVPCLTAA